MQMLLIGRPLEQVWLPYTEWEDWRAGMFGTSTDENLALAASALLADQERLLPAMRRVVREWPCAAAVNLTNTGCNRRAWLGQAACCLEIGAPAHMTKRGWHSLPSSAQDEANATAERVIVEWESAYRLGETA